MVVSLLDQGGVGPVPTIGSARGGPWGHTPEQMLTPGLPQPARQWRASGHLRDLTVGVLLWRGESSLAVGLCWDQACVIGARRSGVRGAWAERQSALVLTGVNGASRCRGTSRAWVG